MSTHNLKPKSAGSQTLEYVWYSDDNMKLYDLSGTSTKKSNYDVTFDTESGSYKDVSGNVYRNEISGNDISGALYPFKFLVSNSNGLVKLTKNSGNAGNQFDISSSNIIDILFRDQANNPYLTSYNKNYIIKNATDLCLNTINTFSRSTSDISFNYNDISNNVIKLDLSGFDFASSSDTSHNVATFNVAVSLATNLKMVTGAAANVSASDLSNNLAIKFYNFGIENTSDIRRYSSSNDMKVKFDMSVNALTSGAYISIDASLNGLTSHIDSDVLPRPNLDFDKLLSKKIQLTQSGRQNMSICMTVPANSTGMWIWCFKLVDGKNDRYNSNTVYGRIDILPEFLTPSVSIVNSKTNLVNNDTSTIYLNMNPANYTQDISSGSNNKMFYNLRMLPTNINNVKTYVDYNDLEKNFNLTVNNVNHPFSTTDICLNTLSFTEVGTTNFLTVTAQDLSLNLASVYEKKRDISNQITLQYFDTCQNVLTSKSYNLYVDWLSNNDSATKPTTINVGQFNFSTRYSCLTNLIDNQNGTFNASFTNTDNMINPMFNVKIYTDATLTSLVSDTSLNWTDISNSNINQTKRNDFNVQLNSNYIAQFTPPNLSNNSDKFFMIAQLYDNGNAYMYTRSSSSQLFSVRGLGLVVNFPSDALTPTSINQIANVSDDLDVNNTTTDLSGYIVHSKQIANDLSFNLLLPPWYEQINGLQAIVSVSDTFGAVKLFDVSGNYSRVRGTSSNNVVMSNMKDLSLNYPIYIDLSYNDLETDVVFAINITVTDANNTVYTQACKQVLVYYRGSKLAVTNLGGNTNTLIIYNDSKYVLENVTTIGQMNVGSKDTYNCYSWLAGSPGNAYDLNLARPEFIDNKTGHQLDLSGINVVSNYVANSEAPILYVSYSKWAGTVSTVAANILSPTSSYIESKFANTTYSWIDIKKYVGTLDINYNTQNVTGQTSSTQNTLRLVVIPRPTILLNVLDQPNILINTPSNLRVNIQNLQFNKGSALEISGWSPNDISGNKPLIGKIRNLLKITNGALSLVNTSGTTDLVNSLIFTVPAINDLAYGSVATLPLANRINPVLVFKGKSTPGILTTTLKAQYTSGSKIILDSKLMNVTIYSTDSVFTNSIYTNSVSVNSSVIFNTMPFITYITLDNANSNYDLLTDSRTKNAVFVVLENKTDSTLLVRTDGVSTPPLSAGSISVFSRTQPTQWNLVCVRA